MKASALAAPAALLLAAGPARGGWGESAPVKSWAGPKLNGVAVASQVGEWWAVGEGAAVLKSIDGFEKEAPTQVAIPGLAGTALLTSIWLSPDAAAVHLFGKNRARASFVEGTWRTSTALWGTSQASVEGIAFLGPELGYLVGIALPDGYLGAFRWPADASDATVADLAGDSVMRLYPTARSAWFFAPEDGLIATGSGSVLLRYQRRNQRETYTRLYQAIGKALNAVHFAGARGAVVGGTASAPLVVLLDASSGALTASPSAVPPPFPNLQDVFMTDSGFAVAIGKGGQIAESFDFGARWTEKLALAGASFGRVACQPDGNRCAAVGSYASTGTGAAAVYVNGAPAGAVLINQMPNGTPASDGSPICLSVEASDPDGDPVSYAWEDANRIPGPDGAPAVDQAAAASPPCFGATADCSGTTISGITVRVSDGRKSTELPVSLALTHAVRPPTVPGLSVRSGEVSWSPGRRYEVDAAAAGDCGTAVTRYEFASSAPLPAPRVSGGSAHFDLEGLCLSADASAQIRAVACYASGVCSPSSGALEVTVHPDTSAPALLLPSSLAIGPGATRIVNVAPKHPCARAFALDAVCDDGSRPALSPGAIVFANGDAARCVSRSVQCTVTAQATDYPPAAEASASISLELEALPLPASLAVERVGGARTLRPGEALSLRAEADSPCAQITWQVRRRSTGSVAASGSGPLLELTVPEICGQDTLVVEAVEALSGMRASLALDVEGGPGLSIDPPTPSSFDPSAAPTMGCRSGGAVQIRARVEAPCLEGAGVARWRQLGDLPLSVHAGPALGEVRVTAAPEDFGALIGRTASLELTVESAPGIEASRTFSVRFVPEPFVRLAHLPDRRQASAGEVVWLSLASSTECPSGPTGGIDVRVALEGFEYVQGSAALDGARRPDPEVDDSGQLVFRALPLPGAPEAPPVLRYAVRRSAAAQGFGRASATAYLATAPDLAVSRESEAGAAGPPASLRAISCGCGLGSGGEPFAFAAAAWGALARTAKRKRPW